MPRYDDEEDQKPVNKTKRHDEDEDDVPAPRRPSRKIDFDDEDEAQDAAPLRKKAAPVDDEDDDVPAPPRKKAAQQEEDEDEAPRTSQKRRQAVEDEDEAPARKPAAKSGKNTKPAQEDEDDDDALDVDFGNENLMKPVGGLQKLAPSEKGKVVRFAFIPGFPLKMGHNHYVDGKGTFRCLSKDDHKAICCKELGDPGTMIVGLVLQYSNANVKDGKYTSKTTPIEWELKFVKMSRTNFQDITRLATEDEKVSDFDIIMFHRTNGIGYQFGRIANTARWTLNQELMQEVLDEAAKYADGKALTKKLGKKVNTLEFRAMPAELAGEAEGDMGDIDDV